MKTRNDWVIDSPLERGKDVPKAKPFGTLEGCVRD